MGDLTTRQIDVLRAIIQEYTETGMPVGSEILEKKYKLGVSPATLRNEMVKLAEKDYLKKEHFSSGRVPSAKGIRFYIKHLMREKQLSTMDEITYKNAIWDYRRMVHKLLFHASRTLAQKTKLLSLVVTEEGELYYSGFANLLSQRDFEEVELSHALFSILDEEEFLRDMLKMAQRQKQNQELVFVVGEDDFHTPMLEPCAGVIGEFEGNDVRGVIGVFGSHRMPYETIAPQIRYFSRLIETIVNK